MVRFSSNLKRPKVVAKQSFPLISKEAPTTSTFSKSKLSQIHQINHTHTRSLPTSPHASSIIVHEIGLSTGQAVKKLIEEIDRVLQLKPNKLELSFKMKLSFLLRCLSLLTLTVLSLWTNSSRKMGLFCGFMLISEFIFIELMERKRMKTSVPDCMKEIRSKLRRIEMNVLAETIDLEALYTTVRTMLGFIYISCIFVFF